MATPDTQPFCCWKRAFSHGKIDPFKFVKCGNVRRERLLMRSAANFSGTAWMLEASSFRLPGDCDTNPFVFRRSPISLGSTFARGNCAWEGLRHECGSTRGPFFCCGVFNTKPTGSRRFTERPHEEPKVYSHQSPFVSLQNSPP